MAAGFVTAATPEVTHFFGYPPMWLIERSGCTKSGSLIRWRGAFVRTIRRNCSSNTSLLAESLRRQGFRSCSWRLNRHVRILPSAVRRSRLQ